MASDVAADHFSSRISRTNRASVVGLYGFCKYRPGVPSGTISDSDEYPLVKTTRTPGYRCASCPAAADPPIFGMMTSRIASAGRSCSDKPQCLFAISRRQHAIPETDERLPRHFADRLVIFGEQNRFGAAHLRARRHARLLCGGRVTVPASIAGR